MSIQMKTLFWEGRCNSNLTWFFMSGGVGGVMQESRITLAPSSLRENRFPSFSHVHAISSQNMITRATKRKSRDRNCSSMCCGVPGAAVGEMGGGQRSTQVIWYTVDNRLQCCDSQGYGTNMSVPGGGRPSLMLKAVAKIPNGKAPIPKDIWKPPSPKPKPWNPWNTFQKPMHYILFISEVKVVVVDGEMWRNRRWNSTRSWERTAETPLCTLIDPCGKWVWEWSGRVFHKVRIILCNGFIMNG